MSREYTTDEQIEAMREQIRLAKQRMGNRKTKESSKRAKPAKNRVYKITSTIIFSILIVFLSSILISVLVARTEGNTPNIFGYHLYVVESGSMDPTLKVGSIILSQKPQDPTKLFVDDVVTFKTTQGYTVTHRIVEIVTDDEGNIRYKTKGDNPINAVDKELLTPDRVVAVMIAKVPLT